LIRVEKKRLANGGLFVRKGTKIKVNHSALQWGETGK